MTRGTIYFITNKTAKDIIYGQRPIILQSIEFNGEMYGSPKDNIDLQKIGYYPNVIKLLKKIKTASDFEKAITKFNATHHEYKNKTLVIPFRGALFSLKEKNSFYFDFTDRYFPTYFSDYLYFKNGSKKSFYFKAVPDKTTDGNKVKTYIELQPGKIITFYFGKFIEKI